jgi:actin-related protein
LNIFKLDIAGKDLTEYLKKLLIESGINSIQPDEVFNEIKEKLCYIAPNFENEMKLLNVEKEFKLPDNNIIKIGKERFRCTESLFQPGFIGMSAAGVDEIVYSSILKCDVDIRNTMYCNIVLSGGNTMFEGFSDRLTKNVMNLAPNTVNVKCISSPERKYSCWIGGSILGSLSSFKKMTVSKQEYKEYGASIINRKCF